MGKKIMLQGTASNVGKSTITTGLCRIFKQDGYNVIPFKSQNMALNSFITKEGLEMGRAQVSQAEACKIDPIADMNPILLKPNGNNKSQVIVRGKVVGDMSSKEYHDYKLQLTEVLDEIFKEFEEKYDVVVMEGAGSCAEINLMERDISNMGMAKIADAPVILVGDIDRGGVFASLAGTMLLLPEEYKKRVKGVIINKFRGKKELLDSGIKMLEDIIKVPVLGVLPYTDIKIEEEDSVTTRFKQKVNRGDMHIEVVRTPHMSNFTDFNIFETQEDVSLRYVDFGESFGDPDIVIIPGTKSTIDDLMFLRKNGLEKVEFEDIDFNNKIKTYASNAHDAFYVITPQIIDRLKNNINNISGDILYSIQENKLYLVISSSKNRMEFKRFKNNYEELIESLKEDVSPILETIKQFDLKGEEKEEIWKIENLNL